MKSLISILAFLLLVNIQGFSQTLYSLNGTWQFALAKTEKEANHLAQFYSPQFVSNKFKLVPVPSNWAVLGFEEPVYRGFSNQEASEGFYIREFSIPENWADKRILLHFGGVWSSAEVWLNGRCLGRHDSGYTSFSFDITGLPSTKETNKLAVRVRQITREYKCDVYDDWTLGGIYRDVTLEAMPRERWLDYVNVQTVFDSQFKDADLKIRAMVGDTHATTLPGNYVSPGKPYDLLFTLFTKEGKEVVRRQITVPAHIATGREASLVLHVENPHHWTAETPYLYNLRVDLVEEGKIVHTRSERVGFRQISTEGGIFRINGQAVKLRGVNRHDEHPNVGRATTREQWLQDLKLMKAANINYVRTAHYAPARGFIELCDELGMYVGEEISIGGGHRGIPDPYRMYDPSYSSAILVRSYETIMRDINNPSIIYWSIGNEDPLTSLHMASIKLVKAFDSSRPVLIPWRSETWLPEEIDMLSAHYWQPQEYDLWAAQAGRPVITTEYTHSNGTDGTGGLEARWKALTRHPSGAGGAIWMWADQGIKTPILNKIYEPYGNDEYLRVDRRRGWDGIVDSYRNITRDYWETKAVYAPVYPLIDKVSFISGQDSVSIPIRNDFDFTNLNSIKISWSVWKDGQNMDSGEGVIEGLPHTMSIFKLPIKKVGKVCSEETCYVWFVFTRADGTEINRKAVELEPSGVLKDMYSPVHRLTVIKDEQVVVQVGEAQYLFNPQTGHLASAMLKGRKLITDLYPTIWHKLDYCEAALLRGQKISKLVDLNRYTTLVKEWNIEESNSKIVIQTKVEYTVDKKNHFSVAYNYSIATDGKLYVRYEILPEVEMPWLPIIGMSLKSSEELTQIRWLGLGPYDAYPNKQSAPILGVWGGVAGSKDVTGNKATRWIERFGKSSGIRISGSGYMEHRETTPEIVNILSAVLGRPEGGRKADESVPQLRTDMGEKFIGEFSIALY